MISSPFDVQRIGDHEVVKEIIEGRITPTAYHYSSELTDPMFVRAQNVREGYIDYEGTRRLTQEAFYAEPKAILDAGDVVFTIDGVLLGIAAVHFSEELPCCISNHMVRMRSGVQIIPEYLALYLNSPLGQQQIKRGITGSAIPGLRTDAIKRMFIALPPIDTQRALELPSIGWQLFALGYSSNDQTASSLLIDTFATHLLTEPLSLPAC